jgi:hypothetical protein
MSDSDLAKNLSNRRWLVERLRAEVVGPDPVGDKLVDPESIGWCMTWEQLRLPFCSDDGEEVLWQDAPTKRYGSGILFPSETVAIDDSDSRSDSGNVDSETLESLIPSDRDLKQNERINKNSDSLGDASEEAEISTSDDYLPSALSLSFLADLSLAGDNVNIELVSVGRSGQAEKDLFVTPMGRYILKNIDVIDPETKNVSKRPIYLRRPLLDKDGKYPVIVIPALKFLQNRIFKERHDCVNNVEVTCVSRTWLGSETQRLITVSIVNDGRGPKDLVSIFQAGIRVRADNASGWILPYPEYTARQQAEASMDTQTIRLNYRNHRSFAVGHGIATDWCEDVEGIVEAVWTDSSPVYEMPATTPELSVKDEKGNLVNLKISMRKLSAIDDRVAQFDEIDRLLREYDRWLEQLETERVSHSNLSSSTAAKIVLSNIKHARSRVLSGRELIENNPTVKRAFELANLAMLVAQTRPKSDRNPIWERSSLDLRFDKPFEPVDFEKASEKKGFWRPFQIAFLLMSLEGLVSDKSKDREEVDLIWFPTGGGKTEAYLGVISFLLFYKRLMGEIDDGVTVIMRYTLRLLTAQQFERAATLFCSMEYIRKQKIEELGIKAFSIGLWVGMATSPNKRSDAISQVKKMRSDPDGAENPFILRRCPWCAAKFGAFKTDRFGNHVLGYLEEKGTVKYRCPDAACDFSNQQDPFLPQKKDPLPVSVIDEDLISAPPDLLVATVDKFALLAWKPELRSFFGIDERGQVAHSPPSLIIQDELHLISGPLGTIVGAYETVIEVLCSKDGIKPKIIASTATISNAYEQIKSLYARDRCSIFPPPGLDASDSFFARESREADGSRSPGRMYVGVMAPGYLSMQTAQARVFATLLQWPAVNQDWSDEERDPWWTLLSFFNSLRELGSAATLLLADAREYLRVIATRHGLNMSKQFRSSLFPTELTSRIPSYQIPEVLNKLELQYQTYEGTKDYSKFPVDACLASSIIEVGVDVPRLSMMTIVGQPKTTAQYIQVSSRIGRDPTKPGLVVTILSPNKARDISHFEKFKNYHQKIYSFVEPTSVTPFSIPSVERTLHALVVILVRQLSEIATLATDPAADIPRLLQKRIYDVIEERILKVSPIDRDFVLSKLDQRLMEWRYWLPKDYGTFQGLPDDPSLMYQAGQTPPDTWANFSWPTLTSMRGVDGSAEAGVTLYFNDPTNFEHKGD